MLFKYCNNDHRCVGVHDRLELIQVKVDHAPPALFCSRNRMQVSIDYGSQWAFGIDRAILYRPRSEPWLRIGK